MNRSSKTRNSVRRSNRCAKTMSGLRNGTVQHQRRNRLFSKQCHTAMLDLHLTSKFEHQRKNNSSTREETNGGKTRNRFPPSCDRQKSDASTRHKRPARRSTSTTITISPNPPLG